MSDDTNKKVSSSGPPLAEQIGAKAARKLKARRNPTLLGAALGLWLDKHHSGKHAWTLALLVAGLAIGCLNAWFWVAKEDKAMRDEQEQGDE